jgi:hypothetical protein
VHEQDITNAPELTEIPRSPLASPPVNVEPVPVNVPVLTVTIATAELPTSWVHGVFKIEQLPVVVIAPLSDFRSARYCTDCPSVRVIA